MKIQEGSDLKTPVGKSKLKHERLHSADSDEGVDILQNIEMALAFKKFGQTSTKKRVQIEDDRGQNQFNFSKKEQW